MIGILLITHGNMGEALLENVCHILGNPPPSFVQLGVNAQDDPGAVQALAQQMLAQVDQGDGVLVMTDIYGATPSNIAVRLLQPGHIEGVAGVNLPMLLRILDHRKEPLAAVVARAVGGAKDGVVDMLRTT